MSGFERGPGRSLAEHVDQAIEAAFADQRLVGAVVLVAHRGQWLYRRAAGLADREAGRTMGEDSLFRLASVSKPIVSVAALSLVDEAGWPSTSRSPTGCRRSVRAWPTAARRASRRGSC